MSTVRLWLRSRTSAWRGAWDVSDQLFSATCDDRFQVCRGRLEILCSSVVKPASKVAHVRRLQVDLSRQREQSRVNWSPIASRS